MVGADGTEEDGPPKFRVAAYNGGVVRMYWPGYMDRPAILDLAGLSVVEPIPVLMDHSPSQIVGQSTQVAIKKSALMIDGMITGSLEDDGPSRDIMTHARNGFVWKASPGISVMRVEEIEGGASADVNGKKVPGPLYVVREGMLDEISFLAMPADRTTRVDIAARAAGDVDMEFVAWLKGLGFDSADDLSEVQRTQLTAKFEAEEIVEGEPEKPKGKAKGKRAAKSSPATRESVEDPLAEARAKLERRDAIKALMRQFVEDYPDAIDAIEEHGNEALGDESWTPRDFENLLLRECTRSLRLDNRPRASASAIIPANEIEVGMCRAMGMSHESLEKGFDAKTLECSEKRFRYGLSLSDALQLFAKFHGYDGNVKTNTQEVLAAALPPPHAKMASGPSTYDVSGIIGNVLNRQVVDYFSSVDMDAMERIAADRPTRDFRQVESYAVTSDFQFAQVNPGGELTHGTFGEQQYTNQALTYGRMVTIDRQTLINDDLGALNDIARLLGRGGALALLNRFWTVFINNSTFFTAARGNFDDGADSALDLDGLTSAKVLFNLLTDPNGKPMNVTPRVLLVPPELEATAKAILNSILVVTGEDTTLGNANIHSGTLDLAMARELSNSSYTGYSTTKWYILANPGDVPVIQRVFLNGVSRPTIENAQADFNILGISMRGYFDFGVALQEYRGGVGMAGV
jgi:hypothetical protein